MIWLCVIIMILCQGIMPHSNNVVECFATVAAGDEKQQVHDESESGHSNSAYADTTKEVHDSHSHSHYSKSQSKIGTSTNKEDDIVNKSFIGSNTNENNNDKDINKSQTSHEGSSSFTKRASRNTWKLMKSILVQGLGQRLGLKDAWVQCGGHRGGFMPAPQPGWILKKLTDQELQCFTELTNDELREFVPKVKGKYVNNEGQAYIEMQDLAYGFSKAHLSIMDIKMGARTFCENEFQKASSDNKLRSDLYEKMIKINESAPTAEEKQVQAITKLRYMKYRESISSTPNLGFRIEAQRINGGAVDKEFKTVKSHQQVLSAFRKFTANNPLIIKRYCQRLKEIRHALTKSKFFNSHELIGSSLLFVHDHESANIWLIDFAKTFSLPDNVTVTHSAEWNVGNHEDGYLTGIDNIISLFDLLRESTSD
ncbi:Inositol-trisphosphate 3-kinase A [Fragariocoptes setiger]|uniref:Kinase n=1 Tax=Fragariocoptes setiger TaxID=1670756 RepID=A0ABQ7SCU5_9ACAR|nr:Inositol-trisphosphate 3-kinase A [Fragariocoptes setiger]